MLVVLCSWLSIRHSLQRSVMPPHAWRRESRFDSRPRTSEIRGARTTGNCCTILAYGQSGYGRDASRSSLDREEAHGFPYYFLVYSEQTVDGRATGRCTRTFRRTSRDTDMTTMPSTRHPARITFDFTTPRSLQVDGSWSRLPDLPGDTQGAEALTWFDGVGLVYTDTYGCRCFGTIRGAGVSRMAISRLSDTTRSASTSEGTGHASWRRQ